MDLPGAACDWWDGALHRHRRRGGGAVVELAHAVHIRLADDHILASRWTAGALSHPLRSIWRPQLRAVAGSSAHHRAMGTHEPRRAGTIPTRGGAVWLRGVCCGGEGAMMSGRRCLPLHESAARLSLRARALRIVGAELFYQLVVEPEDQERRRPLSDEHAVRLSTQDV